MACTDTCLRLPSGAGRCHCAACHHTFSRVSNFDMHRRGGKCVNPELLLMQECDGVWGFLMSDETRELHLPRWRQA